MGVVSAESCGGGKYDAMLELVASDCDGLEEFAAGHLSDHYDRVVVGYLCAELPPCQTVYIRARRSLDEWLTQVRR